MHRPPVLVSHLLLQINAISHQMLVVANNSWPLVLTDLNWFIAHGNGKKMYFDEVSLIQRHL